LAGGPFGNKPTRKGCICPMSGVTAKDTLDGRRKLREKADMALDIYKQSFGGGMFCAAWETWGRGKMCRQRRCPGGGRLALPEHVRHISQD